MKVKCENVKPLQKNTEMLCAFAFEDEDRILGIDKANSKIYDSLRQSIKETNSKLGKISVNKTMGEVKPQRILLAGLGKKEKFNADTIRFVSGKIALKVRELGLSEFSVIIPEIKNTEDVVVVKQVIEGIKMSLYSFDKYKKKSESKIQSLSIITKNTPKILKAIKEAEIVSEGVIFTRDIANLPPNDCNPSTLANFAKILATKNKMKCTIFSKSELKKKGFGGITAVGQGSKNEPKMIVLEYNNSRTAKKPIVIVGKAVTFDTGGISIKPSEKMDEMKFDKCGGCTVLGIMKSVSELHLPINLVGIIPSVENMPSGESYRPGDIIKLFSEKTAEILNTDAEGRLILADALAYGEKKFSPKEIIDFATLTGACIVALGTNVAGLVTNDNSFAKRITESSNATAEEVWQLPLNEDYMDMIKSEVADMKNTGIGRAAGTITAAAFLKNAIEKTPWVHFDIAGVAWTQQATKEKSYNPKGATGFGVRLILDYLSKN